MTSRHYGATYGEFGGELREEYEGPDEPCDSHPEPRADCDCIGERHTAECIQGRSGDYGDGLQQEHEEPAVDDSGPSEDFEAGAEAMRKACWVLIQSELRLHGWGPGDGPWTRLKAAIEGATP